MDERAVLELYRFLTPRRLQKVFYHPDLFISHHIDRKLTLSFQMRRGFRLAECKVLVVDRFALATGARANLAGCLMEQWGVLLSSGRTLVTASPQAVFSWPPRLTVPVANALVRAAKALGRVSGYLKLRRATDLNTPPPEGVLFVRLYNIAGLSSAAEAHDAILALADGIGVRAGRVDVGSTESRQIERALRREGFRTFRKVAILGYLPGPLKNRLGSFCGGTAIVDFSDVAAPPVLPPAGMDATWQTACARWLRDLSSPEAVPSAPRRHGVLLIAGSNVEKTVLGRGDREKVLHWIERSGLRARYLEVKGDRMADLFAQAGAPSYKTILALGAMSSRSKDELKSLVGDVEIADLGDLPCSPDVYRAVSAASCLEATPDAAPFLEALRTLAGEGEGPGVAGDQAESSLGASSFT